MFTTSFNDSATVTDRGHNNIKRQPIDKRHYDIAEIMYRHYKGDMSPTLQQYFNHIMTKIDQYFSECLTIVH